MSELSKYADYSAALSGAVYYPLPDCGYLRLQGADRLTYLQRQTSNDLNRLQPERSVLTALLTPTARILDVLRVVHESDQALGVLTLPGRASATARYFSSRIFFRDKVTLTDASSELFQLELFGPTAPDLLERFGLPRMATPDEVKSATIAGVAARVIAQPGFSGLAYRLLAPSAHQARLEAILEDNGALRLTESNYHILRVENGLPGAGFELSAEFTPLEVGLQSAVAEGKGCYTGQEVIARQITYDKITQRLVGLRLGAPVTTGERIWADAKPVGVVTSAVVSPRFGPIALAVIRRPYFQAGSSVIIGNNSSVVVDLPFTGSSNQ